MLAAGCLLEGETILVLAGLAAERGYLHPFGVVVVASVTAFIGDQILFWLGRWRGPALLARWPSIAAKASRVHDLIERHQMPVIIRMRFAYGLRDHLAGQKVGQKMKRPEGLRQRGVW